MAIQSRLATGYWMRKAILSVLFFAFGIWAVVDGWFVWPEQARRWQEYNEVFRPLDERHRNNEALIGEEARTWDRLKDEYSKPPRSRQPLDYQFQRWVIVPLCFGIGAMFLITWRLSARRSYTYNEDGSLVAPEGVFKAEDMTGIDMTRWMSKSIAMLEIHGGPKAGGQAVKLDAWIYAGLEDVIEALNKRFHPEEYAATASGTDVASAESASGPAVEAGGMIESDVDLDDDEDVLDETERNA